MADAVVVGPAVVVVRVVEVVVRAVVVVVVGVGGALVVVLAVVVDDGDVVVVARGVGPGGCVPLVCTASVVVDFKRSGSVVAVVGIMVVE